MKTLLSLEVIDLLLQAGHLLIRVLYLNLSTLFSPIILVLLNILNHADCTENDTPKMSPCFAHHNIIQKKFHQLRTFAWWFLISTLISILILAHLNKSKGSETELKKSQLGKLSDFREIWCIIYFPCNPRARTQNTHLSVPVGSGKRGGL